MIIFSRILSKIFKHSLIATIRKNKNSKIGKKFKIGNFCNISIYDSSIFFIGNSVSLRNFCNFLIGENAKLILGDNVFLNNYCSINVLDKIEIGENTLFGEGVKLYDHNHEFGEKIEHQKFRTAPINIGKNCWLGSNVTVLRGVTIGDNCIIGAGCLIYKDVPANSVVKNASPVLIENMA